MIRTRASLLKGNKGFTLIELALALAIVGLVILGFFQLVSSMSRQSQDRQTAAELRRVTEAVQTYMAQRGSSYFVQGTTTPFIQGLGLGQGRPAHATEYSVMQTYLPAGMTLQPTYSIYFSRAGSDINGTPSFQALVVKAANTDLTDARGATIAAQAGGGFVYRDAANQNIIVGSRGSWQLDTKNGTVRTNFGLPGQVPAGSLASLTNSVSGVAITSNMLSRVPTGNVAANTMMTDLKMGLSAPTANVFGPNIDMKNGGIIDSVLQGLRFEQISSGGPLLDTNCGPGNTVNGLTQNSSNGGYLGRLVLGRNFTNSPVLLFCSIDNSTSEIKWRDFSGQKKKRKWVSYFFNNKCPNYYDVTNNTQQDMIINAYVNGDNPSVLIYVDNQLVTRAASYESGGIYVFGTATVPVGSRFTVSVDATGNNHDCAGGVYVLTE